MIKGRGRVDASPDQKEYSLGSPTSASASSSAAAQSITLLNENSQMRMNWIERQLQLRSKEFTEEKKLHVMIGTWNVNAKKPSEDLSSWLVVDKVYAGVLFDVAWQKN